MVSVIRAPSRRVRSRYNGDPSRPPDEKAETIKLKLPKEVIHRLNRTQPRESLRTKVCVHSMDLAGRPSTVKLAVVLRGRNGS